MIFFLIAFCLISVRVYFSWSGKDKERRGVSESNMVIKSDDLYEEINYAGKFEFTEDESAFKSISPGGYFKFRLNDEKVKAESNLQGRIEYSIFDGKNNLPLDDKGRALLRGAIREMIVWGYDPEAHLEKTFQKGGVRALLNEVDSMRSDQVKLLYLRKLFAMDSLSPAENMAVVSKIKSLGSDRDKVDFLEQVSARRYQNHALDSVYFDIIANLGSDRYKWNALNKNLDEDSLSVKDRFTVLKIAGDLGSDRDRITLYGKMIDSEMIQGPLFDSLLRQMTEIGSDRDKTGVYSKLTNSGKMSEIQWMDLIIQCTQLGSDVDKANILTEIGQKMPKTAVLKAAFLQAARSISNDSDFGKVVRIIQ